MSRTRIRKFIIQLLDHGTWDRSEAEVIKDITRPRDHVWASERFRCAVCGGLMTQGVINYNYMLYNGVWALAGLQPHDLAHFPCVESQLGRDLMQADFQPCPMNALIHWLFEQKIPIPKN